MNSVKRQEQAALARWQPGPRWYHPLMTAVIVRLSRFTMNTLNTLSVEGMERFESSRERGDRGLLTFSNHVALFDDPLIVANLALPDYDEIRWVAADAINFFGSAAKAWLFTAGKAVPIVRGTGLEQLGLRFLIDRLREGQWVHMFPEGTRTRDPGSFLAPAFKPGIGRLMAEARPLVLPFYHHGMHDVLPVGARLPRCGKTVRVAFGETIDCDGRYIEHVAAMVSASDAASLWLWEALATRAHEALARLARQVRPDADSTGGAS